MFKMASAGSTLEDTKSAVESCLMDLEQQLGQAPQYIMIHSSVLYDQDVVRQEVAQRYPLAVLHGATSCAGALSAQGVMQRDGWGLAMMAIADEDGDYGTGFAPMMVSARDAAVLALDTALDKASRLGQVPELIWVSSSPGQEEDVIRGLQDIVGAGVVIVGGSSADNDISGNWRVFDTTAAAAGGIVVSVFYPSVKVGTAFQCTYDPSQHIGRVTKAQGRTVYEIDHQPARQVYNDWTGGVLAQCPKDETTNILGLSSLHPLGRRVSTLAGADFHILSHPETVRPDGSISLFAEVNEGDEFVLMSGTEDMLVTRASKVVRTAQTIAEVDRQEISGAIIVYCAGCMLTVQDRVSEIHTGLKNAMGDAPFIGTFTFGEQGRVITDENRHGNLMVSAVVFGGES